MWVAKSPLVSCNFSLFSLIRSTQFKPGTSDESLKKKALISVAASICLVSERGRVVPRILSVDSTQRFPASSVVSQHCTCRFSVFFAIASRPPAQLIKSHHNYAIIFRIAARIAALIHQQQLRRLFLQFLSISFPPVVAELPSSSYFSATDAFQRWKAAPHHPGPAIIQEFTQDKRGNVSGISTKLWTNPIAFSALPWINSLMIAGPGWALGKSQISFSSFQTFSEEKTFYADKIGFKCVTIRDVRK